MSVATSSPSRVSKTTAPMYSARLTYHGRYGSTTAQKAGLGSPFLSNRSGWSGRFGSGKWLSQVCASVVPQDVTRSMTWWYSSKIRKISAYRSACRCCSSSGSSSGYRLLRSDHSYTLTRSEEHTSELQSRENHVCRLLLEKKQTLAQNSPARA